jgi:RNA polymerase sigma-70 factor (ECF subfamily)
MIVEFTIRGGFTSSELSDLIGLSKAGITRRRLKAFQKMHEKMEMQKEQLKMVMGREVTLREIIEYAG